MTPDQETQAKLKQRAWQRGAYLKNPAKYREREKRWRQANPERDAVYGKRWREKNPEKARQLQNARQRAYMSRKRSDPGWVLRRRISARMLRSLKSVGGKKRRGWETLVG